MWQILFLHVPKTFVADDFLHVPKTFAHIWAEFLLYVTVAQCDIDSCSL